MLNESGVSTDLAPTNSKPSRGKPMNQDKYHRKVIFVRCVLTVVINNCLRIRDIEIVSGKCAPMICVH